MNAMIECNSLNINVGREQSSVAVLSACDMIICATTHGEFGGYEYEYEYE